MEECFICLPVSVGESSIDPSSVGVSTCIRSSAAETACVQATSPKKAWEMLWVDDPSCCSAWDCLLRHFASQTKDKDTVRLFLCTKQSGRGVAWPFPRLILSSSVLLRSFVLYCGADSSESVPSLVGRAFSSYVLYLATRRVTSWRKEWRFSLQVYWCLGTRWEKFTWLIDSCGWFFFCSV